MLEGDIGNRQRGAGADDGQLVGILLGVGGTTMAMICVSQEKPSGNNGRTGRSMRRDVRVSFSDIRPSRLMKPPGIFPAA